MGTDPNAHAASGLARLAGILRAEAANGLYWGADPGEDARLRRLRAIAAGLYAEVDPRSYEAILAILEADTGLRTPMPGTEIRIDCADGARLVRRRRLGHRTGTLGERLAAVAAALGTDAPGRPVAVADTDLAGLPCPHTFLLVYEMATGLDAAAAAAVLEPSEPDLGGEIPAVDPFDTAVEPPPVDLRVSKAAKDLLDEAAAVAADSIAASESFYQTERHTRVARLCDAATADPDLSYPPTDCGDLAADCVAVGADAAAFDGEGRVLLIRRTDTGQWAVPGGATEVGEPVALAAVREAREETGLDVELVGLSWVFDKRDTDLGDSRMPIIMSFLAVPIDPSQPLRLAELEASDARWATRAETEALDLFKGHGLRIPEAFERYRAQR